MLKMFPFGSFVEIKCPSLCRFGDNILSLSRYFSVTLVKYSLKIFAISSSFVYVLLLYVMVLMLVVSFYLLFSSLKTLLNFWGSFLYSSIDCEYYVFFASLINLVVSFLQCL